MLRRIVPAVALIVFALSAVPALGWSNKEHQQLTRIAALRLINAPDTPPDMKAWLREAMPGVTDMEAEKQFFLTARVGFYPNGGQGLSFWACVPDQDVATAKQ